MSDDVEKQYKSLRKEFDALDRQIELLDVENNLKSTSDKVVFAGEKPEKQNNVVGLMAYARSGHILDAQNAITVGGGKGGAYLIPDSYATEILKDLAYESVMRKYATVMTTNGTYNMPIGGSAPTFEWIGEGGTYPKPDTTFTNKTLDAFKAGGIILVAEELLNDESFGLEAYLKEKIVEGLAVLESGTFYTADGVNKPKGMSVDITLTTTLAAVNTITLADVEDLFLSVPAKARKEGKWIVSDKFYKAIFKMKDTTGNYILRQGSDSENGTIFGKPFEIDDVLEGGASEPLAYFGKINDYVIGDRGEMAIQRLDQTYAEEGYVGFKVYKRTDGKLSRSKYIAQLKNHA